MVASCADLAAGTFWLFLISQICRFVHELQFYSHTMQSTIEVSDLHRLAIGPIVSGKTKHRIGNREILKESATARSH